MFIHSTTLKVSPENAHVVVDILSSEKMLEIYRDTQGLRFAYILESAEEPGKIISQTFWDSMTEARNGFSSPAYAALLKDLYPVLIASPERLGYNLLSDVKVK